MTPTVQAPLSKADLFADGKYDARIGSRPQGLDLNLSDPDLLAYMSGYLEGLRAKVKKQVKPKLKVWAYVKRELTPQEQYQAHENGFIRFEYREIAVFLDPIPKPITPRLKVICRCLYPAFEFDSWHLAGEEDDDAPF